MAFTHKEGHGTIFRNNKKTKDNQPDWTGAGVQNGKEIEIAGWDKQGRGGEFISLSFKPKGQRSGGSQGGQGHGARSPVQQEFPKMKPPANYDKDRDIDDDIPF